MSNLSVVELFSRMWIGDPWPCSYLHSTTVGWSAVSRVTPWRNKLWVWNIEILISFMYNDLYRRNISNIKNFHKFLPLADLWLYLSLKIYCDFTCVKKKKSRGWELEFARRLKFQFVLISQFFDFAKSKKSFWHLHPSHFESVAQKFI